MDVDAKWKTRRGWGRWGAVGPIALPVAVATLILLGALLDLPRGAGGELSAVRVALAQRLGPGDRVLVAPPGIAPSVAAALARPVSAGYPRELPDGAPRVSWLVTRDGAAQTSSRAWSLAPSERLSDAGDFRITRVGADGARRILFDCWDGMDRAAPVVGGGDEPRACPPVGEAGRYRCGPRGWNFVGRHIASVGGRERRCIWAHPISKKPVVVVFPDVPLGGADGYELRGGYGFVDGTPNGAAVTISLLVDGRRVGRYTVKGKPEGWKTFVAHPRARKKHAGPERGELRFVIETADNRWRQLCFDAVVVGRATGGGEGAL